MKKSILTITGSFLLFFAVSTSCKTPAEKVEKAQENVTKANNELDSAISDYVKDIDAYRLATSVRITENEKTIAELKANVSKQKMKDRAEYERQIKALEQKNVELKKKLDSYKAEGNEKWRTFKAEFSKEMDDLGKSIKDLTKKED